MTQTLDDLVAGRPDGPPVPIQAVADRLRRTGRVLVVLDDDPTGTQAVSDLPVLLDWSVDSVTWALEQDRPAVYVMTNTRSLSPERATQRVREVVRHAVDAAGRSGRTVSFVSRSDSTLRGHFPAETDAIASELADATGDHVDGVVVVPAFPEAGRVTVDHRHYARVGDAYVPVGETEFARDATFGYTASDLRDWVAEKSEGRIAAADVATVGLEELRAGPAAVTAVLQRLRDGQVVVADAVTGNDLRTLAVAVLDAEAAGRRLVHRAGPSFPRALIGQDPTPPLRPDEIDAICRRSAADDAIGGLVVVGSHVAATTAQVECLLERRCLPSLELDVRRVLEGDGADEHVAELAAEVARLLGDGGAATDVVVSTSRRLVAADDGAASLEIAGRVSTALVEVVRQVVERRVPRFVLAKGGITSSDVAARGLGIGKAMVRGSVLPGVVSLWEPVDGAARGVPFVVFAGNVGDVDSLADVVDALTAQGAAGATPTGRTSR